MYGAVGAMARQGGGDYISPIAGLVLLVFSLYLFMESIRLMSGEYRDVATSLLAALIGFVSLSGAITLIRTWSLARAYGVEEKSQETEKEK